MIGVLFMQFRISNIDYPGVSWRTLHVRNLDLVGSSDTQGTEIIYQIAGSSKAKDLSLLLTYLLGLALILDELGQRTKSHKNIIKIEAD